MSCRFTILSWFSQGTGPSSCGTSHGQFVKRTGIFYLSLMIIIHLVPYSPDHDPVPLYFRAPYIQNFTLSKKKITPITGESQVSTGISSGRSITRLG